jgi:glycosyltransferase involved in cell wall biosynthesis
MPPAPGKLRLGYFTPSYPGITGEGGIGTYTCQMVQTLAEWGHEIHVITPGAVPATVHDGKVSVHVIRTQGMPVLERLIPGAGTSHCIYRALSRIVRQQRLDLVECPNWDGFGWLFALRRKVPLVVRLSTSSAETQAIDQVPASRAARWDVRRERWLARRADALVTHSAAHRTRMAQELEVAVERIALAPHGIQVFPDFCRPSRAPGDLRVVFLGRLEKRKGALDLIHSISDVLAHVPDTRFYFIGADRPHCPGGVTHAEYIRATLPETVRSRIQLLGRLPDGDVDRWLQMADLFVAPSLYESFGLIFLEAMRWETPVVGTTAGGIPEIIADNETGVLVPPGNPAALAQTMIALLRDEGRRAALGAAGRKCVESQFSVERMAGRAMDLYTRTLESWWRAYAPRQKAAGTYLKSIDAHEPTFN